MTSSIELQIFAIPVPMIEGSFSQYIASLGLQRASQPDNRDPHTSFYGGVNILVHGQEQGWTFKTLYPNHPSLPFPCAPDPPFKSQQPQSQQSLTLVPLVSQPLTSQGQQVVPICQPLPEPQIQIQPSSRMEDKEHQHELFPINQEEQLQSLSQSQITAAVESSLLYSDAAEPTPLQDLTAHAEDMTPHGDL